MNQKISCASIVIMAVAAISSTVSSQEIAQDITGYKVFKFGMSRAKLRAEIEAIAAGVKVKEDAFEKSPIELQLGSPDQDLRPKNVSPQQYFDHIEKMGGAEAYIESLLVKHTKRNETNDWLSAPGKVIFLGAETHEFVFRNDSLKQYRRIMESSDKERDVTSILTEKYGLPKVKLIKTDVNPILGASSSVYSFSFDSRSGRIRLIASTASSILLDKLTEIPMAPRKNPDSITSTIDSIANSIRLNQLNELKEAAAKVTPIRITYTEIGYAKQSEIFSSEYINSWKAKAVESLKNKISTHKSKIKDEY